MNTAYQGYVESNQAQGLIQPQSLHQGSSAGNGGMGEMTSQMGGLAIGDGSMAGASRANKKKPRHAFHALDNAAGSVPSYNGSPYNSPNPPGAQQFNTPSQQQRQGAGYVGNQPNASANLRSTPNEPFNPAKLATQPQIPSQHGVSNSFNAPMSAPGGLQASSQQGRVDPEQIPSVPLSRDGPAEYYLSHIYPTLENHLPPPGAVPFVALDQGNSSPRFARLTMNNIPSTAEALASTGLPLGLLLQPLASLQSGETPIPVLDFGETGPPRCRRCRAYINPFMTFRSGGNKFVCNMCNFPNEVPSEYFSPVSPQGLRVDREQRPELTRGTVEFMVPKEYWAKDPVGLRLLFLIDVGQESVNQAFLEGICEGILGALYGENETSRTGDGQENVEEERSTNQLPPGSRVGIVTFDKEVHFYNLLVRRLCLKYGSLLMYSQPTMEKAQMMVMPDIDDPFVPLSEGLFVDPYESKYVYTDFPASAVLMAPNITETSSQRC